MSGLQHLKCHLGGLGPDVNMSHLLLEMLQARHFLSHSVHSPLHAAGYFLSPDAFYSTGFHLDAEVAIGLISSLVHIVKELDVQVKVATQLDVYKVREGCFNETSQADQLSGLSPGVCRHLCC